MKTLDKSTTYNKLFEINKKHNIDVSKYVEMVAGKSYIPAEVIVFINRYSPIPQLETYNAIYNRRKTNPLYKNLVNENASPDDMALGLSSLLTQVFIRMKTLSESEKIEFSGLMNVSQITEVLSHYSSTGDTEPLRETFLMIRDTIKHLFKKED